MCGKKDEQFTSQNISSNKREVTKAADPKIILNPSVEVPDPEEDSPKDFVACPVCGINVLNTVINRHLDECLNSDVCMPSTSSLSLSSNQKKCSKDESKKKNSMKPVTKIVYGLLKDSELKNLLRREGLDTRGDRKTLTNRHKRFAIIWNAQCDEDKPKSRDQIIREVKKEEENLLSAQLNGQRSSSAISSQVSNGPLFNYDRKTDPKIIEEKQREILKKNEPSFSKLIADVRRRKLNQKSEEAKVSSISVINDGDLEVVHEDPNSASMETTSIETIVSYESDEDDFFTVTPQKKIILMSKKGTSRTLKFHDAPEPRAAETLQTCENTPTKQDREVDPKFDITPKRKRDLSSSPPKRLHQQLIGSPQKVPAPNKAECPVCHTSVQLSLMSSHVDRCLEMKSNKVETRRSKRVTCFSNDPEKS